MGRSIGIFIGIGVVAFYRNSCKNSTGTVVAIVERNCYRSNQRDSYRNSSIDTFWGFGPKLRPSRFLFKRFEPQS